MSAKDRIQSYEVKVESNPYRKIAVQTKTQRSHEFSSQGWDVFRIISTQNGKGEFMEQHLMAPASCLVLMAGIPTSHLERGGRIPFAHGDITGTPRNLFLIGEFIADGTFKFLTEEAEDRYDAECKKYAKEIEAFGKTLKPEVEVEAPVAKPAKGKAKVEAPIETEIPAEA